LQIGYVDKQLPQKQIPQLRQLLYSCFGRLFLAGYNGLQITATKPAAFVETPFAKLVLERNYINIYFLLVSVSLFTKFSAVFLATMTVKEYRAVLGKAVESNKDNYRHQKKPPADA
jgi:hypothetical protein